MGGPREVEASHGVSRPPDNSLQLQGQEQKLLPQEIIDSINFLTSRTSYASKWYETSRQVGISLIIKTKWGHQCCSTRQDDQHHRRPHGMSKIVLNHSSALRLMLHLNSCSHTM